MSAPPWWRDAVIYQIYVRSFADGNGDGVGDLPGITSRLEAVRDLGVDAIWVTPFYPSPQADGGYDVADYRDVDPRFGTLDDFDAMLALAHRLELKVLVDLVPNHTSREHPWFRAALAATPTSAERERYIFREGRGPAGDDPPNDWQSVFGGPAWTRVDDGGRPGQWYLHLFDNAQPDLNWMNQEVRDEFESVLRFWLDRGIDGFRIDVAHGLVKDPHLPDIEGRFVASGAAAAHHPHWDRDEVHDVYRSWRKITDSYAGDRVFVAEAWVATLPQLARYLRPDELHTAFDFAYLQAPWRAPALRKVIDDSIAALHPIGAPTTWVLSNHDTVRHVTRYGGGELGVRRARAAALLMLALPGGAYVYQGEELGLPEVVDLPDELRQDPTFFRTKGASVGRDGCRVPLPWSGDRAPFGFGTDGAWLPQPDGWADLTVERQAADPRSVRSLYQVALRLRREHPALGDGSLEWLPSADTVLAFRREPGFACVVNVGDAPAELPSELRGTSVLHTSAPLLPDPTADGGAGGAPPSLVPGSTAIWLDTAPSR